MNNVYVCLLLKYNLHLQEKRPEKCLIKLINTNINTVTVGNVKENEGKKLKCSYILNYLYFFF